MRASRAIVERPRAAAVDRVCLPHEHDRLVAKALVRAELPGRVDLVERERPEGSREHRESKPPAYRRRRSTLQGPTRAIGF